MDSAALICSATESGFVQYSCEKPLEILQSIVLLLDNIHLYPFVIASIKLSLDNLIDDGLGVAIDGGDTDIKL